MSEELITLNLRQVVSRLDQIENRLGMIEARLTRIEGWILDHGDTEEPDEEGGPEAPKPPERISLNDDFRIA